MAFGVNKDTEIGGNFLTIKNADDAIKEGVKVVSITHEIGQYGPQMKLVVSCQGAEAIQWYAAPSEELAAKNPKKTMEVQAAGVSSLLASIGWCFDPNFKFENVDTFEEAINELVKQTKDKWATTELRAKFVYNKKGYISLPLWPKFLENSSVARKDTDLKVNPKFDTIVPPIVNKVVDSEDPFADTF